LKFKKPLPIANYEDLQETYFGRKHPRVTPLYLGEEEVARLRINSNHMTRSKEPFDHQSQEKYPQYPIIQMKEARIPQKAPAKGNKLRSLLRVVHFSTRSIVSSPESEVDAAFFNSASFVADMKAIVKGTIPTVITAAVEKRAVRLTGVCLNKGAPARTDQAR
jgi:hypothetical protein